MYNLSEDYQSMYNGILSGAVAYLQENEGIESLVLGVSGGIDSALVAALAREVCKNVGRKVELIGVVLPIVTNTEDETLRAQKICNYFCGGSFTFDMSKEFNFVLASIEPKIPAQIIMGKEPSFEQKVRMGNLKARLRMSYLYNLAHKHKGIVLSTDNFTEYNLGFWTLHGDVGDYGFIQELWKTEVYGLAKWFAFNKLNKEKNAQSALLDCVYAKPTDGLGITNSDIDQLLPGFEGDEWVKAYNHVDNILIDCLSNEHKLSDKHPVYQRFVKSKFKRDNPVSIKRDMLLWKFNKPAE